MKLWRKNIYCSVKRTLLGVVCYFLLLPAFTIIAGESNALYMHNNSSYKDGRIERKYDLGYDVKNEYGIKKYGSNLISSSLIKSPREGASAIIVEKDSQTLWIYTSKNGEFINVLEIPCSTGEVDGPKMVEGDKKTPEGIYFLKHAYEDRFLTPIYGRRAFTTDYPNFVDITLGRTGSAIWLHGTNKRLKPMDSNGCVAMNNDDVVKISQYVVLDETPVIIMDRVEYASLETSVAQRINVLDFISMWIESLNRGSYLEYLCHYAADHLPDVQWWAEWVDIRSRTAISGNRIMAKFDNIGIYRHKDHFVVLMDFQVTSPYRTMYVGKRKLFIRPHINNLSSYDSNQYKIIGDVFQTVAVKRADKNTNYFITAASQIDEQYREYKIK